MERELRLFQVLRREKGISIKTIQTRMHSSRMRTVRCSGRFIGGVCLGNVFPGGVSAQDGVSDQEGVSAQEQGCLPRRGGGLSAQEW